MAIDKLNPNDLSNFCIEKYFNEISNIPQYTRKEEKELFDRLRNGDDSALEEIIMGNLKFVVAIAKNYKGYGVELNDLINEGNLGLIKAAYKFNPDRGYKFISYAVWWVKQSIKQSLNNNSRSIRYPNSLINKLNKIKKENNSDDITDLDEENCDFDVGDLPTCTFYEDMIEEEHDELNIEDDSEVNEVSRRTDEVLNDDLKSELSDTMNILDDRERDIIEKYYGLNTHNEECKTLEELGEDYDLTKERVRQIKKYAMKKLRYNVDNLYKFLE